MSFTHTEKRVFEHILNGQMVPMDLRPTMEALRARGHVFKNKMPRGTVLMVSDAAQAAMEPKTAKVNPMRVNVNSGKLLDDERDAKDEPWRNKNFRG